MSWVWRPTRASPVLAQRTCESIASTVAGGGVGRCWRRVVAPRLPCGILSLVRKRLCISPERYFVVSAAALVALTVIVFTGAAVRVTGSGLGCPNWPQCYHNGRFVAELNSHAWIEFGNRMFTGLVALSAGAAGLLAYFRRPFRRDLAVLGTLL